MTARWKVLVISTFALGASVMAPAQQRTRPSAPAPTTAQLTQTLLTGMVRILNELPTDGKVGTSRIVRLMHGRQLADRDDKAAHDAFRALYKNKVNFNVATIGAFDRNGKPQRFTVAAWTDGIDAYDLKAPLMTLAQEVHRNRKPVSERTINSKSVKTMVSARPVFARRECLSCHAGAKAGDVVGVALVTWRPNAPRR